MSEWGRKKNTTSAECESLRHKSLSHRYGSFKLDAKTHFFLRHEISFIKIVRDLFAEWSSPWLWDQSEKIPWENWKRKNPLDKKNERSFQGFFNLAENSHAVRSKNNPKDFNDEKNLFKVLEVGKVLKKLQVPMRKDSCRRKKNHSTQVSWNSWNPPNELQLKTMTTRKKRPIFEFGCKFVHENVNSDYFLAILHIATNAKAHDSCVDHRQAKLHIIHDRKL